MESALAIQLERASGTPLIDQLASQVRRSIEQGSLPPASRLPSTRALASQLGVSRTVTNEAYATLLAEGYLETKRGAGTFVVDRRDGQNSGRRPSQASATPPRDGRRWLRHAVQEAAVDPPADTSVPFRICEPDAESFPDDAWRTAARAAVNERFPEGYPPPAGDPELRRAIAAFLLRERGLHISPEELIVTSGTTQSLDLIARATLIPGDVVAFEDPGYRLARQIFTDRHVKILPVPVDGEGLRSDALLGLDPRSEGFPMAVYLTPSHQFPFGSALSYCRRLELLEWAERHDVLVIEDDYDSEFRFDGPVLPSLRSNDRSSSVAYLGTFSKSLSPRLRMGYMIAPKPLHDAILQLKVRRDQGTGWLHQRILARYLSNGAFTRHLRRVRRLYRRRRDVLLESVGPLPPGASWCGLAAGLHATLLLPEALDSGRIVAFCRQKNVVIADVASYQVGGALLAESPPPKNTPTSRETPRPQGTPRLNGLVLGYGASCEAQIKRASAAIRWALDQAAREPASREPAARGPTATRHPAGPDSAARRDP